MTKFEVIKQLKTIARMNQVMLEIEKIFGKSIDDNELGWIVSEMVENLIMLSDIPEENADKAFNFLFILQPSDNFQTAYENINRWAGFDPE